MTADRNPVRNVEQMLSTTYIESVQVELLGELQKDASSDGDPERDLS